MIISKEAASKALMPLSQTEGFGKLQQKLLPLLESIQLPKPNEELWRYTKPDLFNWGLLETPLKGSSCKLVSETSTLPKGVEVRSEKDLLSSDIELLEKAFSDFSDGGIAPSLSNALAALTTHVSVVEVSSNADVSEPIELDFTAAAGEGLFAPLILVHFLKGSSACVVLQFQGGEGALLTPRVEVVADNGASGEVISVKNTVPSSQLLLHERIHAQRDASVDLVSVNLGGNVVRHEVDCYLHQPGGRINVSSVAYTSGRQHYGLFTNQHHLVPNCNSDLYAKTVLTDRSRSVYYGYIRVSEKAHQTDAYQTNRNLLLSTEARADAIPNLEIKANDVKCSHGASVGQVSEDELFYLQARGIPKAEAERLLVQGFLADILVRIKRETIRERLSDLVFRRANCGT
jgi:FeS assembly protein SufD